MNLVPLTSVFLFIPDFESPESASIFGYLLAVFLIVWGIKSIVTRKTKIDVSYLTETPGREGMSEVKKGKDALYLGIFLVIIGISTIFFIRWLEGLWQ